MTEPARGIQKRSDGLRVLDAVSVEATSSGGRPLEEGHPGSNATADLIVIAVLTVLLALIVFTSLVSGRRRRHEAPHRPFGVGLGARNLKTSDSSERDHGFGGGSASGKW